MDSRHQWRDVTHTYGQEAIGEVYELRPEKCAAAYEARLVPDVVSAAVVGGRESVVGFRSSRLILTWLERPRQLLYKSKGDARAFTGCA